VKDNFILVVIDSPRRTELPEATQAQNNALKAEYGIRGFPTVVLADAEGREYGRHGYQRGGPEGWLEKLETVRKNKDEREELFDALEGKEGSERAQALEKVIEWANAKGLKGGYNSLIDEIIELDADDSAGLKSKYGPDRALGKVQELLAKEEWDNAMKAADAFLSDFEPTTEQKQNATYLKAVAQYKLENWDACIELLEETQSIAPDTQLGRRMTQSIANVKKEKAKAAEESKDSADDEQADEDSSEEKSEEGPKKY
jgi:hypothetical protein